MSGNSTEPVSQDPDAASDGRPDEEIARRKDPGRDRGITSALTMRGNPVVLQEEGGATAGNIIAAIMTVQATTKVINPIRDHSAAPIPVTTGAPASPMLPTPMPLSA
jgi:hypothetical protein